MFKLNKYKRIQKGLKMMHLFPQPDKTVCANRCGNKLTGRQTRWCSKKCNKEALAYFSIIKGCGTTIRNELFKVDKGFCRNCGVETKDWQADHIVPVCEGGGACYLDNFQTLCLPCHKAKTKKMYKK